MYLLFELMSFEENNIYLLFMYRMMDGTQNLSHLLTKMVSFMVGDLLMIRLVFICFPSTNIISVWFCGIILVNNYTDSWCHVCIA